METPSTPPAPPLPPLPSSPPPPPLPEEQEDLEEGDSAAALRHLLEDPLLRDLPPAAYLTVDFVDSLIALETGAAMLVNVVRMDGECIPCILRMNATVKELRRAYQHTVAIREEPGLAPRKISWRRVWRQYAFETGGQLLLNENTKLTDLGVRNKTKVILVPKPFHRTSKQERRRQE